MKERPILFNTEMVEAILDGRKTQTRLVVKPRSYIADVVDGVPLEVTEDDLQPITPPYGEIGDLLWVRETWLKLHQDHVFDNKFLFKVDQTPENEEVRKSLIDEGYPYEWKPSIFMPKDAARIWLKVTNRRCELLQDISYDDVKEEGCPIDPADGYIWFAKLWESIEGSESWKQNPLVWVYEFEVLSTTGKP